MMRLKRARWLRIWAAQEAVSFGRGIPELRGWMYKRGYIEGAGAYSMRVTDAGRAALEQAIADHARHGRPNLGEPSSEQRARRVEAEEKDRERERARHRATDQQPGQRGRAPAPGAPRPGPKNMAETLAMVRTWSVMAGDVPALLTALQPARKLPRTYFVDLTMGEALAGHAAPMRPHAEVTQELLVNTEVGDLVVTHGRPSMDVAFVCHQLRRRVLLLVPGGHQDAAKKALETLPWVSMPAVLEKPTGDAYVVRMEGKLGAPKPDKVVPEEPSP